MKKRSKTGKKRSNNLVKEFNSGVKRVEKKLDKFRAYTVTKFGEVYKSFDQVDAKFDRVALMILGVEKRSKERDDFLLKTTTDGFKRIEMLYENSKSDFKFVTEGHGGLSNKVEDHEKRITKLEDLV